MVVDADLVEAQNFEIFTTIPRQVLLQARLQFQWRNVIIWGSLSAPFPALRQVANFKMVSSCIFELLKEAFIIIYACVGLQLFVSTVGIYVCLWQCQNIQKVVKRLSMHVRSFCEGSFPCSFSTTDFFGGVFDQILFVVLMGNKSGSRS